MLHDQHTVVATSATDRRLLWGLSAGLVIGAAVTIVVEFVDSDVVVGVGVATAMLQGAASLLAVFVVFGPHLTESRALRATRKVAESQDLVSSVVKRSQTALVATPFWAGALGGYALGPAIVSQLIAALQVDTSDDVPEWWALVGLAITAVGLVLLDFRSAPRVVFGLVLGIGLTATSVVLFSHDHDMLALGSLAFAALVLMATAVGRRHASSRASA